jgi:predicted PurR-regulated permease PerM
MVWALILDVTLYQLHQSLANKIGGRQGLAATLLVVVGVVLIAAPTAMLMSSLGDSVHQLVNDVAEQRAADSRSGRAAITARRRRSHTPWCCSCQGWRTTC